jgi:NADH:ubiquinone oxidoreductase subunit E
MEKIACLARALHEALDATGAKALTSSMIDGVAEAQGCERAHAWVAAGLDPTLELAVPKGAPVLVGMCVGQCQLQGAVPILERFLEERDRRVAAGLPDYELLPRRCLDMCSRAPVVLCQTKDGVAGLTGLSAAEVPEAVEMIFESIEDPPS